MRKSDLGVEITRVENGFSIKDNEGKITVVEEKDGDELSCAENLLWEILNFFDLVGNKYDRERLVITRKAGEKYTPKKGEKIIKDIIYRLETKKNRE